MVTVLGLKNCSSCKKATRWLEQQQIEYRFIDYREQPIAAEDLSAWAAELGWPRLVNRASMTWRKLDESRKSPQDETDWLALVAEYPTLVRRPVVITEAGVGTGFSEQKFSELFGR